MLVRNHLSSASTCNLYCVFFLVSYIIFFKPPRTLSLKYTNIRNHLLILKILPVTLFRKPPESRLWLEKIDQWQRRICAFICFIFVSQCIFFLFYNRKDSDKLYSKSTRYCTVVKSALFFTILLNFTKVDLLVTTKADK